MDSSDLLKAKRRWVTVEIPVFVMGVSFMLSNPVINEYLFERFAKEKGFVFNNTATPGCGRTVNNNTLNDLMEVRNQVSHWDTYLSIAMNVPGILVGILLGTLSDNIGRKPVIAAQCAGNIAQAAAILFCLYLDAPAWLLIIGNVCVGLFGSTIAGLAGATAYLADVTSTDRARSVRFVVLIACFGCSMPIASTLGGFWTELTHEYTQPIWFIIAINIASALYIYFLLPESTPPSLKFVKAFCSTEPFLNIGRLFHYDKDRAKFLFSMLLSFVWTFFSTIGVLSLLVIYLISEPLCFSKSMVGVLYGGQGMQQLTGLVFVKVMHHLKVPSSVLVYISLASMMAYTALLGVATTPTMVYISLAAGFAGPSLYGLVRATMSSEVRSTEQGAMFAVIAATESLFSALGGAFMGFMYPVTSSILPGLVFILTSAVLVIPFICLTIGYYYRARLRSRNSCGLTGVPFANPASSERSESPVNQYLYD